MYEQINSAYNYTKFTLDLMDQKCDIRTAMKISYRTK